MDEKEANLGIKWGKMLKLTQGASSLDLHGNIVPFFQLDFPVEVKVWNGQWHNCKCFVLKFQIYTKQLYNKKEAMTGYILQLIVVIWLLVPAFLTAHP
jgi:hypothetical protein